LERETRLKLSDTKGEHADPIVVTSRLPSDRSRPHLPKDYVLSVRKAGGHPIVFSSFPLGPGEKAPDDLEVVSEIEVEEAFLPDNVSGLLLTGGGDINPALYGEEPHPQTHNTNDRRDQFELALLTQALERDLPVLCICRGMQLLNVHFGGTLEQHLADKSGRLNHDRDRPRADPAHHMEVLEGTILAEVMGTDFDVNSHHHQGLGRIADPLQEIGWAEDGVLEAVVSHDHSWVVGVQWHPEVMAAVDRVELSLFGAFVDATRAFAAKPTQVRSA
jgi:putative glutamine amidotransferase